MLLQYCRDFGWIYVTGNHDQRVRRLVVRLMERDQIFTRDRTQTGRRLLTAVRMLAEHGHLELALRQLCRLAERDLQRRQQTLTVGVDFVRRKSRVLQEI